MRYPGTALLCAILISPGLTAQQLEEMVVQSSALGRSESEMIGALNVLDSDTLQREAGSTLGGTLHNQIGVASSSFGPNVGVPVIRGQSGKRVEVLQNNSSVGDVSDTSADHATATESLLAERIEILRGPATLRFGPGAIGGVVNVIDYRIHSEPLAGIEGAAEVRYGDNNNERVLVGRTDLGWQNWVLHLDGLRRDSGLVSIPGLADAEAADAEETTRGFIANSDAEARSGSLGLSWIGSRASAGISFNQLDNNYGVPPGAHAHHDEEDPDAPLEEEEEQPLVRLDLEQQVWQSEFRLLELPGVLESLNLTLNRSDYQHREIEQHDGASETGTLFDKDSIASNLEVRHQTLNGWDGVLGWHYQQDDFSAQGAEAFVPPSETSSWALYLVEETQVGNATLETGVRWDRQRIASAGIDDLSDDSLNLNGSLMLPLGESQRLGLILSRAQRAPVAEELLSDGEHVATGTYEIGDPELDPETSVNLELSYLYQGDFDFRVTLYQNRFSNYIYERDTELLFNHDLADGGANGLAACTDASGFDDPQEAEEAIECFLYDQEDARFVGLELETEFDLSERQRLRLWGDVVRGELDAGADVPRMPPARLGLNWIFEDGDWSSQLSLVKAFEQNRPGEGQEATAGYYRLDAFVGYSHGVWDLFVRGTNLTDEEIRNATSFLREVAPEPGRALSLGTRYRF